MHKQKIRELNDTVYFEKFLNSLINDMTFCLEEGLVKLKAIKEHEMKLETNRSSVTQEEIDGNK